MRIVVLVLFLGGCGGARALLIDPGCQIGTSHVGQTCRGVVVHGDVHDRDGDGVRDDEDICPNAPARGTTNGCPPHATTATAS